MIALSIASTWLALSALAFVGLSALGRGDTRESVELDRATPHDAPASDWSSSSVLIAGADTSRRAALRAELGGTLPGSTPFAEADSVFEVLECAPASRLVVLAGDLDDTSARSVMRIVGERYPRLPVLSVEVNGSLPADEPA